MNSADPKTLARCGATAFAAALFCAGAFAQSAARAPAYSIQARSVPNTLGPDWNVAISGEWLTQCPPTLQGVSLDGSNLRIDARSVLGLCQRQAMSFSIDLNPALALDRRFLPGTVYQVSFYAADGAQAQPKLRAFALIDRSLPGTPSVHPETGFWWSSNDSQENADRTVASIELQHDQLSVSLMSYDASGQPLWYFGVAPFNGHIAHLTMLRLTGGSDPFSPASAKPHGSPALMLDLEFSSDSRARAWLSRPQTDGGLQLQSLSLVRLALTDSSDGGAWRGDWIEVSDAIGSKPQRVNLVDFHALDPAHFLVQGDNGRNTLLCSLDPAQPELPPTTCSLHIGGQAAEVTFDSVAINRMDGTDADGRPVHLLRISR